MSDSDDIREFFDSKYLGSWDLRGQDVTVTIAKITPATVEGEGGIKSRKPLIFFKGWEKPYVCNATMREALYSMYGTYSAKELQGKRVTLYATTCKGKKGGQVACIRPRPTVPKNPGVPQSAVGFVPVDQAVRAQQVAQSGEDSGNTGGDGGDRP
jgi:hypothetical protein